MTEERLHGIYIPLTLHENRGNQTHLHHKERRAERRHKYAVRVGAISMAVTAGLTWHLVAEHEQQINRDTEEIAVLAKAQGYLDARAYKPTVDKGTSKEAYVTLVASACEAGEPKIIIGGVTATLQKTPVGIEVLYFSRKNSEEKIDGQWKPITQIWITPDQFCVQETGK